MVHLAMRLDMLSNAFAERLNNRQVNIIVKILKQYLSSLSRVVSQYSVYSSGSPFFMSTTQ